MKIIAELVRVRQDWDPDTNTHNNSVIFEFAGVQVEVPCSPEQVREIIIESQRHRGISMSAASTADMRKAPEWDHAEVDETAGGPGLDDALAAEMADDEVDRDVEFGGDFVQDPNQPVAAPVLFQGPAEASALETALAPSSRQAPPPSPTQQREALVAARRAQDPAQQRAAQKAAMRERAQSVPRKKMATDEAGNPIPYVDRGAHIAGPVGRPEVQVTRASAPISTGGDDDRFPQG